MSIKHTAYIIIHIYRVYYYKYLVSTLIQAAEMMQLLVST